MTLRQNSVFKITPHRTISLKRPTVQPTLRDNQLSNYRKVIYIDGLKNGELTQVHNRMNSTSKQRQGVSSDRPTFQNRLLNFMMGAVKNQYKQSFKKKESAKNKERLIYDRKKTHSFTDWNFQNGQKSKSKDAREAKSKQRDQQKSVNCLKNLNLCIINLGKSHPNQQLNFLTCNKHSNCSNVQKKSNESMQVQQSIMEEQNQDGYLSSQSRNYAVVSAQTKSLRMKTQQLRSSEYDENVTQFLSLEQEIKYQSITLKSAEMRVISALEMLKQPKKRVQIRPNSRGLFFQKHRVSHVYEAGFTTKSIFAYNELYKGINSPFKFSNFPRRLSIYSRAKQSPKKDKKDDRKINYSNFMVQNSKYS